MENYEIWDHHDERHTKAGNKEATDALEVREYDNAHLVMMHDDTGDDIEGGGGGDEGCGGEDDGEDLGVEDGDAFENSPMSTNSRKRGSSTRDTATSPSRKSKSPMVKVLRGLINEIKGEREDAK